jgi:hypothetical protein
MSDKKTEAILNQVCHQRNREADAVAQLCGEIAANEEAWQAKWGDVEQVRARLAELEQPAAEHASDP